MNPCNEEFKIGDKATFKAAKLSNLGIGEVTKVDVYDYATLVRVKFINGLELMQFGEHFRKV